MSPSIECILEMLSTSCNKPMWPQANFNLVLLPPCRPQFQCWGWFQLPTFLFKQVCSCTSPTLKLGVWGRVLCPRKLMLSFDQGWGATSFKEAVERSLMHVFASYHVFETNYPGQNLTQVLSGCLPSLSRPFQTV